MGNSTFSPSSIAGAMQLRTREKKNFDRIESSLSSAKSSTIPLAQGRPRLAGWFDRLNITRPFAKPITQDEIVWLLDNTAYKCPHTGNWQAEFIAAIFEREDKERLVDMVNGVVRAVGLADDAAERRTIQERVLPFLWDVRPARLVTVSHRSKTLKLGPSNVNGLSSNTLAVSDSRRGSLVQTNTETGGGQGSIAKMQTYYAGQDGWGIISGQSTRRAR